MIIERLLITALLLLVGSGAFVAAKTSHIWRLNRSPRQSTRQNEATLLYFRSDACPACPTQSRFIDQVMMEWNGRLALQPIDTNNEPEMARQYKVMTLPTTIILDNVDTVHQINYGLTNAHKLNKQLARLITE